MDIIGRGCRLPGAAGPEALWRVLADGRCTVGEIGDDRWAKARFYNPRPGERGKSYTFAAGVLDDIWGFDPAVFGLSPREAEQMDPQQRVLLQVVWEALEDAGIRPSDTAGQRIGVYVGVSSPDAATRRSHDVGSTDAYTMTGSTLSLVANRVSYVFDWHGPSLSIDTACSSSLVAMSEALAALQAGSIDTAVVGGVNILLSPFPFLGFSAARMLAPDGRCRPFDADGQGYVRAEGAVALVLRRREAGPLGAGRRYAEVVAAGVNSDGRTAGISLPSATSQAALLEDLYARAGVDPEMLAFVEAHGTGTRVGDPAEAEAIGRVLGRRRRRPLPIGSIKSNIGHLEPAAGLAGVIKALLAFEHGELPASLHCRAPNPAIAFADLNIEVAREAVRLPVDGTPWLAGVSAFGFGGTNAHVILREVRSTAPPARVGANDNAGANDNDAADRGRHVPAAGAGLLMLSAQCRDGLSALAAASRSLVAEAEDVDLPSIAAALVRQREVLPERLVIAAASRAEALTAIDGVLAGAPGPHVWTGRAVARAAPVAFVYAGNGSQWAGMGQLAYEASPPFRARFDALSRRFAEIGGWSLSEELVVGDLADKLASARVAQPLLFAIQAALTDVLAEAGLRPDYVLGHSVGEVAAAYAAGALGEGAALRVIAARSASQEMARGLGSMAALALSEEDARAFLHGHGIDGVEIGAINSPRSVTLTGPDAAIELAVARATADGLRVKRLDLEYPFHSELLEVSRRPLLEALAGLESRRPQRTMVSTVTGEPVGLDGLDASYWWRNVRDPVRFGEAVAVAARLGARVFLEISPRAILQGYITESLADLAPQCAMLGSLGPKDAAAADPVRAVLARALARGAKVDLDQAFGEPARGLRLPRYPWQNRHHDLTASPDAGGMMRADAVEHRYLGWRERDGESVWISHLDTNLNPELADHRIGGQVYVPGAVLAEMAMAAATLWLGEPRAEIFDLDILAPLVLTADHMREVRTALDPESRSLTIASRRRLSDETWQSHVVARFGSATAVPAGVVTAQDSGPPAAFEPDAFYARARGLGLDYGPAFRRLTDVASASDDVLHARIAPASDAAAGLLLDPVALDVAFHALLNRLLDEAPAGRGYVPVRFGRLVVDQPGATARSATIRLRRQGVTTALCDVVLHDAAGRAMARLSGARFKAASLVNRRTVRDLAYHVVTERVPLPGFGEPAELPTPQAVIDAIPAQPSPAAERCEEAELLLEASARRVAVDVVTRLAPSGSLVPQELVATGVVVSEASTALNGLLCTLEAAGLAHGDGRVWRIDAEAATSLPALDVLVRTLLADHPEWWPDCAMLAEAAEVWPAVLSGRRAATEGLPYPAALLEAFASATPRGQRRAAWIVNAVEAMLAEAGRPLRVLQIGAGDGVLARPLASLLDTHQGRLLVVDPDARVVESLGTQLATVPAARIVTHEAWTTLAEQQGPFDLIVSVDGLHRLEAWQPFLADIAGRIEGAALVLVGTAAPDALHDVVLGLDPAWFGRRGLTTRSVGPLLSADAWRQGLTDAGVTQLAVRVEGRFTVLAGVLPARIARAPLATPAGKVVIVGGDAEPAVVSALRAALKRTGRPVVVLDAPSAVDREPIDPERDRARHDWQQAVRVSIAGVGQLGELLLAIGPVARDADPQAALASRLSDLSALLQALGDAKLRLWILARGALSDCPVAQGVLAWARTAANELPAVDIRILDLAEGLTDPAAGERLARLLAEPGRESEMLIGTDHLVVPRVTAGLPAARDAATAAATDGVRLDLANAPGRDRLSWQHAVRRAPGPGEIEIEVAATGLNFRDVMWSMGLLPEEALEDGFAGPTLGFECAGRVVRCGAGVSRVAPGQMAMAFAPAAFASHVTVDQAAVAPVPEDMDPAAAATLPVAFITAAYALDHLAGLAAGERVLIHGGAGGVGLAALQIAKARGAVVYATAGTTAKRRLLGLLGADQVLDSRSLAFADEVLELTGGEGVDVVLNSLAGEPMERSLALVRPFGRFLELGKRDFYGNTRIGLRPFRRNVSYFGIDADQLLAAKPALARQLFDQLSSELARGAFVPLPYRKFAAGDVGQAFRLMQQSGHIGKIVVEPPRAGQVVTPLAPHAFRADADGIHVVIGGLGGFGLATAHWLVEHGARRLALVGRTGRPVAGCEPQLATLRATGARISTEAVDVADGAAVAALLGRLRSEAPVRGIVHAAMVLDDDLLVRTTSDRIRNVLAPKVAGADHLDRLTRSDHLQYFVLYSSVTALIGNPGQSAYVAANGYLEGLAKRRRAEGLPGLAVGWGGITDTGYLARHAGVGRAIERRTGSTEFSADEALGCLGELLALGDAAPAAITVAPVSWAGLAGQLTLMTKPLLSRLSAATGHAAAAGERVDLASEISRLAEDEARERVIRYLAEEIARVFRMPLDDVGPARTLSELGMDSLMGLELRLAIQQRLGADIPLAAIAGNLTLADMASRITTTLRATGAGAEGVARTDVDLAHQHVAGSIEAAQLAPLMRAIDLRDNRPGAVP